jgi:hypothetical protein
MPAIAVEWNKRIPSHAVSGWDFALEAALSAAAANPQFFEHKEAWLAKCAAFAPAALKDGMVASKFDLLKALREWSTIVNHGWDWMGARLLPQTEPQKSLSGIDSLMATLRKSIAEEKAAKEAKANGQNQ